MRHSGRALAWGSLAAVVLAVAGLPSLGCTPSALPTPSGAAAAQQDAGPSKPADRPSERTRRSGRDATPESRRTAQNDRRRPGKGSRQEQAAEKSQNDDPGRAEDATAGDDEPADQPANPGPEAEDDKAMPKHPFPRHIKAPELAGGVGWINTAGPLELADLKGKFVLLDFWTYCCINCMHILPELKKLEAAYPNELVVIGVHSAKFDNEEDTQNITDAVLRYEIEHPVVNDANHVIWQNYAVNSWPSLRIIDPEGNLVAGHGGEITFEVLDRFLRDALPYYKAKGVLDETPLRFDLESYQAQSTPLRYPGKLLADEAADRLFIADSNHNRIVISRLDGSLVDVIGSGQAGSADGEYQSASFNHPQGMALVGEVLYVADTENHMLRKIDLAGRRVVTIAGDGQQGRNPWPGLEAAQLQAGKLPDRFVGKPLETGLNSPWALWAHAGDLYIAMAGPHQIWKMPLDESEIGPYAGNGREDIVDGPLLPDYPYEEGYASFAQPSGLASDGEWLYVADSEGSSVRRVPFDPQGKVGTVVGTSHLAGGRLFEFGDVDGEGQEVRLQHVLGVVHHAGLLYVADTYNNKIKVIDPEKASCTTLAGDGEPGSQDDPARFDEPAGISAAGTMLYIADTNNHRIRTIDLADGNRVSTLEIAGLEAPNLPEPQAADALAGAERVQLPPASVRAQQGVVYLDVEIELPEGYKINPLAPMKYQIAAKTATGPLQREGFGKAVKLAEPSTRFEIALPAGEESGKETIEVGLTYYYCQEGSEGLCKVGSVIWSLPIELDASAGESRIPLRLVVE